MGKVTIIVTIALGKITITFLELLRVYRGPNKCSEFSFQILLQSLLALSLLSIMIPVNFLAWSYLVHGTILVGESDPCHREVSYPLSGLPPQYRGTDQLDHGVDDEAKAGPEEDIEPEDDGKGHVGPRTQEDEDPCYGHHGHLCQPGEKVPGC